MLISKWHQCLFVLHPVRGCAPAAARPNLLPPLPEIVAWAGCSVNRKKRKVLLTTQYAQTTVV